VELTWDGTPQGFKTFDERNTGLGSDWDEYVFESLSTTDLSNGIGGIQVEITNGQDTSTGGDTEVEAVYIEVKYVCTEEAANCPYCSVVQEVQMTGCRDSSNDPIMHCWEYQGTVDCGDTVDVKVRCDPDLPVTDSNKWSLQKFQRSCASPITPSETGVLTFDEECDKPPSFYGQWDDTTDCQCCFDNCCDWDGTGGRLVFTEGPFGSEVTCYDTGEFSLRRISNYVWEYASGIDGPLPNGDELFVQITCDPNKNIASDDINERLTKWSIVDGTLDFPCATNFRWTGATVTTPTCDKNTGFEFAFDSLDGCTGSTCEDPDD
jgi:hypothetical protein